MTKQETLDAFARGDIDRRSFITRLSVLGVSAGAAVAYATAMAPNAFARTTRNDAGFLISANSAQTDEEYGTACTFASDEEALGALLDASTNVRSILAGLGDFTADDFAPGVYDLLTTIASQQDEHADALASLTGGTAEIPEAAAAGGSADDLLAALSEALTGLVSTYAAVGPALQDGEARQTVTNIGLSVAAQAALASVAAGNDPLAESFPLPVCPI